MNKFNSLENNLPTKNSKTFIGKNYTLELKPIKINTFRLGNKDNHISTLCETNENILFKSNNKSNHKRKISDFILKTKVNCNQFTTSKKNFNNKNINCKYIKITSTCFTINCNMFPLNILKVQSLLENRITYINYMVKESIVYNPNLDFYCYRLFIISSKEITKNKIKSKNNIKSLSIVKHIKCKTIFKILDNLVLSKKSTIKNSIKKFSNRNNCILTKPNNNIRDFILILSNIVYKKNVIIKFEFISTIRCCLKLNYKIKSYSLSVSSIKVEYLNSLKHSKKNQYFIQNLNNLNIYGTICCFAKLEQYKLYLLFNQKKFNTFTKIVNENTLQFNSKNSIYKKNNSTNLLQINTTYFNIFKDSFLSTYEQCNLENSLNNKYNSNSNKCLIDFSIDKDVDKLSNITKNSNITTSINLNKKVSKRFYLSDYSKSLDFSIDLNTENKYNDNISNNIKCIKSFISSEFNIKYRNKIDTCRYRTNKLTLLIRSILNYAFLNKDINYYLFNNTYKLSNIFKIQVLYILNIIIKALSNTLKYYNFDNYLKIVRKKRCFFKAYNKKKLNIKFYNYINNLLAIYLKYKSYNNYTLHNKILNFFKSNHITKVSKVKRYNLFKATEIYNANIIIQFYSAKNSFTKDSIYFSTENISYTYINKENTLYNITNIFNRINTQIALKNYINIWKNKSIIFNKLDMFTSILTVIINNKSNTNILKKLLLYNKHNKNTYLKTLHLCKVNSFLINRSLNKNINSYVLNETIILFLISLYKNIIYFNIKHIQFNISKYVTSKYNKQINCKFYYYEKGIIKLNYLIKIKNINMRKYKFNLFNTLNLNNKLTTNLFKIIKFNIFKKTADIIFNKQNSTIGNTSTNKYLCMNLNLSNNNFNILSLNKSKILEIYNNISLEYNNLRFSFETYKQINSNSFNINKEITKKIDTPKLSSFKCYFNKIITKSKLNSINNKVLLIQEAYKYYKVKRIKKNILIKLIKIKHKKVNIKFKLYFFKLRKYFIKNICLSVIANKIKRFYFTKKNNLQTYLPRFILYSNLNKLFTDYLHFKIINLYFKEFAYKYKFFYGYNKINKYIKYVCYKNICYSSRINCNNVNSTYSIANNINNDKNFFLNIYKKQSSYKTIKCLNKIIKLYRLNLHTLLLQKYRKWIFAINNK